MEDMILEFIKEHFGIAFIIFVIVRSIFFDYQCII